MSAPPRIYFNSPNGEWLQFPPPRRLLVANRADEVADVLAAVAAAANSGHYAAGFVCYEAAPAFDSAFQTKRRRRLVRWRGLRFPIRRRTRRFCLRGSRILRTLVRRNSHGGIRAAVDEIKRRITAGDVYQVNFTYPRRGAFCGLSAVAVL